MALGAVIFSFPIALFGAAGFSIQHGLSVAEALALYATLGLLTMLTAMISGELASRRNS